jgi:membrane-associated PAP2 superfamily phosphatase
MDSTRPGGSNFWRWHLLLPLCLFVPAAIVLATTDLDRQISWAWAYDAAAGTFPARHSFWAEQLLHGYGRDLIWLVVLGSLAALGMSLFLPALASRRRSLLFVVVVIGLTTALIGGLKQVTNVHCPWELQGFGGGLPYVHVFATKPPAPEMGACFPGAHAGSGFALFALYFAFRDRNRRLARLGLLAALLVGGTFALAQEARGAHFLSHDVWSAFLAWASCLLLYLLLQPGRLTAGARSERLPELPGLRIAR